MHFYFNVVKIQTSGFYPIRSSFFFSFVGWQSKMIGPCSDVKLGKLITLASRKDFFQSSLQYALSNLSKMIWLPCLLFVQVYCTPWNGISMRLQSIFHLLKVVAPLMFGFPPNFWFSSSTWLKSPNKQCFPGWDHMKAFKVSQTYTRSSTEGAPYTHTT